MADTATALACARTAAARARPYNSPLLPIPLLLRPALLLRCVPRSFSENSVRSNDNSITILSSSATSPRSFFFPRVERKKKEKKRYTIRLMNRELD